MNEELFISITMLTIVYGMIISMIIYKIITNKKSVKAKEIFALS